MTDNHAKPDINEQVVDERTNESPEQNEEITSAGRDLEAELDIMRDQLLRAVAETENLRKRTEKQIEEAGKFAISSFARDLINVQENLYRATSNVTNNPEDNSLLKSVVEGVEVTRRELENVFQRHGISRIAPEIGSPFDHNLHQAVAHVPDPNHAEGTISALMQAGYQIKDRLLRPAMVAVAKAVE